MVGLDNAGKTATVRGMQGGKWSIHHPKGALKVSLLIFSNLSLKILLHLLIYLSLPYCWKKMLVVVPSKYHIYPILIQTLQWMDNTINGLVFFFFFLFSLCARAEVAFRWPSQQCAYSSKLYIKTNVLSIYKQKRFKGRKLVCMTLRIVLVLHIFLSLFIIRKWW